MTFFFHYYISTLSWYYIQSRDSEIGKVTLILTGDEELAVNNNL